MRYRIHQASHFGARTLRRKLACAVFEKLLTFAHPNCMAYPLSSFSQTENKMPMMFRCTSEVPASMYFRGYAGYAYDQIPCR